MDVVNKWIGNTESVAVPHKCKSPATTLSAPLARSTVSTFVMDAMFAEAAQNQAQVLAGV